MLPEPASGGCCVPTVAVCLQDKPESSVVQEAG